MMKYCVLALMLVVSVTRGQDRIPEEEAKRVAKLLVEAGEKIPAPFKLEVDTDKPYGKRKDDKGALFIPAKNLNADTIAKAGDEIVPVGQLWMRHIVPVVEDKPASSKQLNVVTVKPKDEELIVNMCWAGVRKEKDNLVLVLIGKDKKPLLTVPLEKIDESQERPIEFIVSIEPDQRAVVNVQFLGKYKVKLQVAVQTD